MYIKRKIAVVALSGGLDSCVTAAIAKENYDLAFLHINYGQKTEKRELKAFNDIANFYQIEKKMIVDLPYFKTIGGSSLTDDGIEVSKGNLESNLIPTSYVPFRNANILSVAVSWAEILNANAVFIGAVEEDSSGYPDCRKEFFKQFELMVQLGTKPETEIKIETPIIDLMKDEIIKIGIQKKAPIELTWSCYKNENEACGECDSCLLRLNAFKRAGYKDPIKYLNILDN